MSPVSAVDKYPTVCGGIVGMPPSSPGRLRTGGRNVPFGALAASLAQMGNLDRSVVDQTGLSGTCDFAFEWTPQRNVPAPHDEGAQPDASGATFPEALQEQLGLRLKSATGPVDVFVIDHVEEPSPN